MALYTLYVQYAGQPPESRSFDKEVVIVGRDVGDIALMDPQVSGRHAELRYERGRLVYRDLGSTNGSFLGATGERLQNPVELGVGSAVRLGQSILTVQHIEQAKVGTRTVLAGPGMVPPVPNGPQPPGAAGWGPPSAPASSPAWAPPAPPPAQAPPPPQAPAAPGASYPSAPPQGGGPGGVAPQQPPASYPGAPPPQAPESYPGAPPQQPQGYPSAPPSHPPAPPGLAPTPAGYGGGGWAPPGQHPQQPHGMAPQGQPAGVPVHTPTSDAKEDLQRGWGLLSGNLVPVVGTWFALNAAIGVITWGFSFLPAVAIVGSILSVLLSLAMIPLAPAIAVVLVRGHLGQPTSIVDALRIVFERGFGSLASFVVAAFIGSVALLVPLGFFVAPIWVCENKQFLDINGRNVELFKRTIGRTILAALIVIVALVLVGVIAGLINEIPVVGGLLAAVINAAAGAAGVGLLFATATELYFDQRNRYESADVEARARLLLDEQLAKALGKPTPALGSSPGWGAPPWGSDPHAQPGPPGYPPGGAHPGQGAYPPPGQPPGGGYPPTPGGHAPNDPNAPSAQGYPPPPGYPPYDNNR